MRYISIPLLLLLILAAAPAFGQDVMLTVEGDTVRVLMEDGTAYIGTIQSETDAEIVLITTAGVRVAIPRDRVRSIDVVVGGRYLLPDPNRSRLLFTPTGRPLERGRGYIAAYELFFPFVGYGLTDRLIVAGGISLIPGLPGQFVYFAPKYTIIHNASMSIAAGVLANTVVGNFDPDDDIPVFGLLYGVGTFGGPKSAVSAGIAFGYADGDFSGKPALMLGGEHQLSSSIKLLTENYLLVGIEDGLLFSGGVRFFGERLAADIGLVTTPEAWGSGFPFLPWLGFAYNFGK